MQYAVELNQGGSVAEAIDRRSPANIKEAVDYLRKKGRQISVGTLYNLISAGAGPRRKKKGGTWVFSYDDLDAWDRDRTTSFEANQK